MVGSNKASLRKRFFANPYLCFQQCNEKARKIITSFACFSAECLSSVIFTVTSGNAEEKNFHVNHKEVTEAAKSNTHRNHFTMTCHERLSKKLLIYAGFMLLFDMAMSGCIKTARPPYPTRAKMDLS